MILLFFPDSIMVQKQLIDCYTCCIPFNANEDVGSLSLTEQQQCNHRRYLTDTTLAEIIKLIGTALLNLKEQE